MQKNQEKRKGKFQSRVSSLQGSFTEDTHLCHWEVLQENRSPSPPHGRRRAKSPFLPHSICTTCHRVLCSQWFKGRWVYIYLFIQGHSKIEYGRKSQIQEPIRTTWSSPGPKASCYEMGSDMFAISEGKAFFWQCITWENTNGHRVLCSPSSGKWHCPVFWSSEGKWQSLSLCFRSWRPVTVLWFHISQQLEHVIACWFNL